MRSLPIITRRRPVYALLVALLAALPVLASLWLTNQHFEPIKLGHYDSYRCATGGDGTLPTFKVLTLTSQLAIELADRLCDSDIVGRHYQAVDISWHPRAFLRAEHLVEGRYQLFWNRRHIVEGLTPDAHTYYLPIIDSPRYSLHWVSLNSPPQLTQAYLADKVVGFSQDQQSLSFYLRPMAALTAAGIELAPQQKRFYPGFKGILKAFLAGEVDIISSTGGGLEGLTETELHFTLMDDDVPSGSWFLQRSHYSPELACELSEALQLFDQLFEGDSTLTPEGCP
ncbi:hypothetical protein I6N98_01775 [Spongiibacter nanhainus]|uniref:ABC-type amino acid transport substrate-binding protein n=1 Tax=Spongiibacter nanhainus TaxID=2794344 RepID=A0A7T4R1D1_9GAMM|nr:hypothetical protein [Spongiibacter nanhainus]QQD18628.1 hypothetical protein I6N98_01775 [Spongiibacter nanhainus]